MSFSDARKFLCIFFFAIPSEKSGMDVAQGFSLISHPSVAVHLFACTDTFGKLL